VLRFACDEERVVDIPCITPSSQVVQFDHYGKDLIKKHKVSPDAWVQMVKQLAYGKMNNGRPAVTYESAQTRKFRLGRTEVIRVASRESKAFVESMLDQSKSVSIEPSRRERGRVLVLTTRLSSRTLNEPSSSERRPGDTFNTPVGLLMVRESIDTCLD